MKCKSKKIQKSIFTRLILTFLIIFLPIYFLSVGIHKWGVTIIRTEITNSMKSQMDYFKTVLQNELIRIQSLQNECLNDDDLLKLANIPQTLSDYEKSRLMNRLQYRLYVLNNSSIYIAEVKVIIPILDRSISSKSGVTKMSDQENALIRNYSGGAFSRIVSEGNELFSRARNLSSDNKESKPSFILQVQFSNEMLQRIFASFNIYEGSGFMLYYPKEDYMLSTSADTVVNDYVKNNILSHSIDNKYYMESVKLQSTKYLTFYQQLDFNNFWLVSFVPEAQVFSPLNSYMYILWILTIFSVIIIFYFSLSTHNFLQRPLKKLVSAFKRVENGEMKFSIQHNDNDEFQYLYTRFNEMLVYINNLIDQVYNQKIMSQKAELKQLQSQINPHFLYNSFFILQRIIQGDDKDKAIQFCNYLGQYFRYVTKNAKDEIPLCQEFDHARTYLEIQMMRLPKTTIICDELPSKYRNLVVPRLILQPIIENIFEHGLNNNIKNAVIAIRFEEAADGLYCIFEDNGGHADDTELQKLNRIFSNNDSIEAESTGLMNINRRIKIKFGDRSGITVSRGDMGGWKVVLFLEVREVIECTDS